MTDEVTQVVPELLPCPFCGGKAEPNRRAAPVSPAPSVVSPQGVHQASSEDAKDAARYRWLRDESRDFDPSAGKESPWPVMGINGTDCYPIFFDDLDAAIDSAIAPQDVHEAGASTGSSAVVVTGDAVASGQIAALTVDDIEQIEGIAACLGDDAAMLQEREEPPETTDNMRQAEFWLMRFVREAAQQVSGPAEPVEAQDKSTNAQSPNDGGADKGAQEDDPTGEIQAWREYAEHLECCMECGLTGPENCPDGGTLRSIARQRDSAISSTGGEGS